MTTQLTFISGKPPCVIKILLPGCKAATTLTLIAMHNRGVRLSFEIPNSIVN